MAAPHLSLVMARPSWLGQAEPWPESFAVLLHALNVPLPLLFALPTAIPELIGGLLVLRRLRRGRECATLDHSPGSAVHGSCVFFSVKLAGVASEAVKLGPVRYAHILLAGLFSPAMEAMARFR